MITELESLKHCLKKETSKDIDDIDWDYVILLEKNIEREKK